MDLPSQTSVKSSSQKTYNNLKDNPFHNSSTVLQSAISNNTVKKHGKPNSILDSSFLQKSKENKGREVRGDNVNNMNNSSKKGYYINDMEEKEEKCLVKSSSLSSFKHNPNIARLVLESIDRNNPSMLLKYPGPLPVKQPSIKKLTYNNSTKNIQINASYVPLIHRTKQRRGLNRCKSEVCFNNFENKKKNFYGISGGNSGNFDVENKGKNVGDGEIGGGNNGGEERNCCRVSVKCEKTLKREEGSSVKSSGDKCGAYGKMEGKEGRNERFRGNKKFVRADFERFLRNNELALKKKEKKIKEIRERLLKQKEEKDKKEREGEKGKFVKSKGFKYTDNNFYLINRAHLKKSFLNQIEAKRQRKYPKNYKRFTNYSNTNEFYVYEINENDNCPDLTGLNININNNNFIIIDMGNEKRKRSVKGAKNKKSEGGLKENKGKKNDKKGRNRY